jgi:hypothetical protein
VPDAAPNAERPSALTYEGMNARVGEFGAGYRASRRGDTGRITRLGGLTIRVFAYVMLAGVAIGLAIVFRSL